MRWFPVFWFTDSAARTRCYVGSGYARYTDCAFVTVASRVRTHLPVTLRLPPRSPFCVYHCAHRTVALLRVVVGSLLGYVCSLRVACVLPGLPAATGSAFLPRTVDFQLFTFNPRFALRLHTRYTRYAGAALLLICFTVTITHRCCYTVCYRTVALPLFHAITFVVYFVYVRCVDYCLYVYLRARYVVVTALRTRYWFAVVLCCYAPHVCTTLRCSGAVTHARVTFTRVRIPLFYALRCYLRSHFDFGYVERFAVDLIRYRDFRTFVAIAARLVPLPTAHCSDSRLRLDSHALRLVVLRVHRTLPHAARTLRFAY